MNVKRIDQIVEVLFQGGPGDEGNAPEPLNKRFSWKDPVTGKSPPKPPKAMLPGKADFDALEAPPAAAPQAPAAPSSPDDRTGSVSMNQMIPPNEMATIDDLLDQYLQMQRSQGPEAAKAWFDKYRTAEFESLMKRVVESLLGEAVCGVCGNEVGDEFFPYGDQAICGKCHVSGNNGLPQSGDRKTYPVLYNDYGGISQSEGPAYYPPRRPLQKRTLPPRRPGDPMARPMS